MSDIKFRCLKPYEINVKVKTVSKNGYALALLYKDARTDMTLLDETVGPENWQTSYTTIGEVLYCTISVWSEKRNMWVSKQSNGTESDMDAEKGQASDALKRAGFLWGIGRELYTAPVTMIKVEPTEINSKGNGVNPSVRFHVKEIGYNDIKRAITKLVVADSKGKVRFSWQSKEFETTLNMTNEYESATKSVDEAETPTEPTETDKTVSQSPISPWSKKGSFEHIERLVGTEKAKELYKNRGASSSNEITLNVYLEVLEDAREFIHANNRRA